MKLTIHYKVVLAFLFSLALCPSTHATHAAGGSLTYTHLGGSVYRLHVIFYRDCAGNSAPAFATVDIHSATCGFSSTDTLYPVQGTGHEITLLCPGAFSFCTGGTERGYQK